jgi:tyrosyl-tRNA synthetase
MSKSLGNYIGIDEQPNEIFGKTMSIPDELMVKYYELTTAISNEELQSLKIGLSDGTVHPRDAKISLAKQYVRMYHGEQAAEEAERHFINVFSKRALPDQIDDVALAADELEDGAAAVFKLLVAAGLQTSNAEAKRSVAQGAVKLNERKLADPLERIVPQDGDIIQVGKRRFARIRLT